MNRAEEFRRAVRAARLPSSAVVAYDTLLQRADWATAIIPAAHQPRSLTELAVWTGMSRRHTANALNVLERYGWLRRERPPGLRRGASTRYALEHGRPRPVVVREPMTDAERAMRYRERKIARERERVQRCTPGVTDHGQGDGPVISHGDSAPMQSRHGISALVHTCAPINGAQFCDEPAGQGPNRAVGHVGKGDGEAKTQDHEPAHCRWCHAETCECADEPNPWPQLISWQQAPAATGTNGRR